MIRRRFTNTLTNSSFTKECPNMQIDTFSYLKSYILVCSEPSIINKVKIENIEANSCNHYDVFVYMVVFFCNYLTILAMACIFFYILSILKLIFARHPMASVAKGRKIPSFINDFNLCPLLMMWLFIISLDCIYGST